MKIKDILVVIGTGFIFAFGAFVISGALAFTTALFFGGWLSLVVHFYNEYRTVWETLLK